VEYFYDIASKGGNINLKSVSGEFKEDLNQSDIMEGE